MAKNIIEENISKEDLDKLSGLFLKVRDVESMNRLLQDLFTVTELKDFVLRIKLLEMLKNKISQRKIGKALNISLCKITRGSKLLKKENSIIKDLLDSSS